jgi:hypothetical protein
MYQKPLYMQKTKMKHYIKCTLTFISALSVAKRTRQSSSDLLIRVVSPVNPDGVDNHTQNNIFNCV